MFGECIAVYPERIGLTNKTIVPRSSSSANMQIILRQKLIPFAEKIIRFYLQILPTPMTSSVSRHNHHQSTSTLWTKFFI